MVKEKTVVPRNTHDLCRARELADAIKEHLDFGIYPPTEWVNELAELAIRWESSRG